MDAALTLIAVYYNIIGRAECNVGNSLYSSSSSLFILPPFSGMFGANYVPRVNLWSAEKSRRKSWPGGGFKTVIAFCARSYDYLERNHYNIRTYTKSQCAKLRVRTFLGPTRARFSVIHPVGMMKLLI